MAFVLENRGAEPEYIRKRIKNTINELDMEKLEDRDVFSMSGGENNIINSKAIRFQKWSLIAIFLYKKIKFFAFAHCILPSERFVI